MNAGTRKRKERGRSIVHESLACEQGLQGLTGESVHLRVRILYRSFIPRLSTTGEHAESRGIVSLILTIRTRAVARRFARVRLYRELIAWVTLEARNVR